MNRDALIHQALAIRSLADSLLAQLAPPEVAACTHPEEQREDFGSFSHDKWMCRACGYSFDSKEQAEFQEVTEGEA